jgi:uncharacterized protein YkwD
MTEATSPQPPPDPEPVDPALLDQPQTLTPDEERCLGLINNLRKEENLPPLATSELLSRLAHYHNENMLEKRVPFGHAGVKERYALIPGRKLAAENASYTSGRADPVPALFENWCKSPSHRKHMLTRFKYIGVAVGSRGKEWFATTLFASFESDEQEEPPPAEEKPAEDKAAAPAVDPALLEQPQTLTPDEERCLGLINNLRKEENLPPLVTSELLSRLVHGHNENMLEKRVGFGHLGSKERYAQIPRRKQAAEIAAYSAGSPDPVQALFENWCKSSQHRKHMLSPFTYVGIAIGTKGRESFGTTLFATCDPPE